MLNGSAELFVVGPARSGTTFLLAALSCSPDIFLFSELNGFAIRRRPNIYAGYGGANFAEHFNNRKKREGNLDQKGAFIPNGRDIQSLDHLFSHLAENYRIVGEKVALADGKIDNTTVQDVFLEEHIKHHFHSWYFISFREPVGILLSSKKHFPDKDYPTLLANLMLTYDLLIQLLIRFPRSIALFYEEMTKLDIGDLFDILEVRRPLVIPKFNPRDNTALPDDEGFAKVKAPLDRLVKIYQGIKQNVAQRRPGIGIGMLGEGYRSARAALAAEHKALTAAPAAAKPKPAPATEKAPAPAKP